MIPKLVRDGFGLAVSAYDLAAEYPELKFLRITSPTCTRDIYFTWHKDAVFTDTMTRFYSFMCEQFPLIRS